MIPSRPLALALACLALPACSRQAEDLVPTSPPAESREMPRPQAEQPVVAPTLIGTVDNPEALVAFLVRRARVRDHTPPAAVAAGTINGGPAHPRITLVYMADGGYCGSGGCVLLVLASKDGEMVELSYSTIVHPPVRVLRSRTNGMPDLSVQVRADYYPGDGAKFVALPFDGEGYAPNPTMPPARLLREPVEGQVVITEEQVRRAFAYSVPDLPA